MKKTMFMAVYNPIEYDGRVKRTATSLAQEFSLTLLCPRSGATAYSAPFTILRVLKPSASGGVFRLLAFWWHVVAKAVLLKPAVIYVHDFFLPFPGWVASRLTHSRLVYDAHELIVPQDGERMAPRERFFYAFEKFTLPRADLVIAANPERAAIMHEHHRLQRLPTVVRNIPPIPEQRFSDADVLARYPSLAKKDPSDLHVVYMGDMNRRRGIDALFSAVKNLSDRYKFFLIGGGPDLEHFRSEADRFAGERVRVLGPVAHEWIHDLLRMNDIGFVTYPAKGLNNLYCAPNKIFEYAHAGLPVVATRQPAIAALFGEFRIGELVGFQGENSAEEIASAIVRVAGRIGFHRQEIDRLSRSLTWRGESQSLLAAVAASGGGQHPDPSRGKGSMAR